MSDREKNGCPYYEECDNENESEDDYHGNVKGYPGIYKIAHNVCYIE